MRFKEILILSVLVLSIGTTVHAQQWAGILDSRRAIDWSHAGVTGGIPHRTNICTTLNPGASAASINSAISSCSSGGGGVVYLNAGTYTLSSGISMQSNVTLRGAGAHQTRLTFTGTGSYYWGTFYVGFTGNYSGNWESSPPGPASGANPANLKAWIGTNGQTGVYTKGATVLNLGSAPTGSPNLQVGDMLQLFQDDDSSLTNGLLVMATGGTSREGAGGYVHGTAQRQNLKVVAINGNAVTVTPGIHMSNWRTDRNPRAFWWGGDIRMAGIEDLGITGSVGVWAGILFWQASDSWVKGVSLHVGSGSRHGILTHITRNVTLQSNWIDPMSGGGFASTTSYGMASLGGDATLVINNIFKQVESPILYSASGCGSVTAYNYEIGGGTGILHHEVGNNFYLHEGNNFDLIRMDTFHGTQNLMTAFRNYLRGDSGPPIDLWAYNRFPNLIGNVLGGRSMYECVGNTSADCTRYGRAIFRLGYAGADATSPEAGVNFDARLPATAMRWGNYDTATGTVRWQQSEVPTNDAHYPNPVPQTQTLPPSFFLSAKPSWWPAGKAWPPIGPDVSGGNISAVGGRAHTLPAQDCYNSVGGNTQNFNAATCYVQSAGSAPASPSALVVR